MKFSLFWPVILLASFLSGASLADEVRPAYIEIIEQPDANYDLLWKVPKDPRFMLALNLPEHCEQTTPGHQQISNGATIIRFRAHCPDGIQGNSINIDGLTASGTDVLLRFQRLDDTWLTGRLFPAQPSFTIPKDSEQSGIAGTYFFLGIEHILFGFDHLLFVFALILIINNTRALLVTITAFTLSHSITLAAATLGFVHVPQQPVEATIALSIVFLAVELVHQEQGRIGIAARFPWLVAFLFGLLHGFGFAGALSEIGLPQQAIPLALVFFNVGVEAGQLIFVATVIFLNLLIYRLTERSILDRTRKLAAYFIGSLASFWLIERIVSF